MKQMKIPLIAILAVLISGSCYKAKLNQPVPGLLSEQDIANKKGVEGLLIGAYSMLDGGSFPGSPGIPFEGTSSNWIFGSICGSEAYKGADPGDPSPPESIDEVEAFNFNADNRCFYLKWGAIYEGIQRTNSVMRIMRQARDMSKTDTTEVKSEALFLRAFYHFEAKKMWNKIPFIDESVIYNNGNYHVANDTSWAPIEKDLIYAAAHLPHTQGAEIGRANTYAAEALLAKAYVFEHKFTLAKPLLADLIANGETSGGLKYALLDNYSDNFNAATKNRAESVFACQSSVNDGAAGANGDTGDFLNFPSGPPIGGYGFFQPSQYLVNHFKTDPVTGLPDLNNFNNKDVDNDDGIQSTAPFAPYTGTLDPRLDWTVGRRGIPYLDWGIEPGMDWVRTPGYGGPYCPKKNVFYRSQKNIYTQSGWATASAMNINLIRYADVLLWAAETEIEIGSLDQAEYYVNLIRKRAANPAGFVHTYIDSNNPAGGFTNIKAANYFIKPYPDGYFTANGRNFALKAVRYERMLELGMEGHRFFDLVRWGIANSEINAYLLKESILRKYLIGAEFKKGKNEYFPIPQKEIDLSDGKMTQNPGY